MCDEGTRRLSITAGIAAFWHASGTKAVLLLSGCRTHVYAAVAHCVELGNAKQRLMNAVKAWEDMAHS